MKAYFFIISAFVLLIIQSASATLSSPRGFSASATLSSSMGFSASATTPNFGTEVRYYDIYKSFKFEEFNMQNSQPGEWVQRETYDFSDRNTSVLESRIYLQVLSRDVVQRPNDPPVIRYKVKVKQEKSVNGQMQTTESIQDFYAGQPHELPPEGPTQQLLKPAPGGKSEKYYDHQVSDLNDVTPGKVQNRTDCGGLTNCKSPAQKIFFQKVVFINNIPTQRFLNDYEVSQAFPGISMSNSKSCVWEVELNDPFAYKTGRCEYVTDFHF